MQEDLDLSYFLKYSMTKLLYGWRIIWAGCFWGRNSLLEKVICCSPMWPLVYKLHCYLHESKDSLWTVFNLAFQVLISKGTGALSRYPIFEKENVNVFRFTENSKLFICFFILFLQYLPCNIVFSCLFFKILNFFVLIWWILYQTNVYQSTVNFAVKNKTK